MSYTTTRPKIPLTKEDISGAASTVVESDLTASRAVVSDTAGKLAASAITTSQLEKLSGLNEYVQAALNSSVRYKTTDETDLNKIEEQGIYKITNTLTNLPSFVDTSDDNFILVEVLAYDDDNVCQRICSADRDDAGKFNYLAQRVSESGAWTSWIKFATEEFVTETVGSAVSNLIEKEFSSNPSVASAAYITSQGKIGYVGSVSSTELGYLNNASGNIQTQINALDNKTVFTTAGYDSNSTGAYVTVCESSALRIQVNNGGGRIEVKNGTTHRFDWVRVEGSSSTSGTGTSSTTFALNGPSGGSGAVRSLLIGVVGTQDGIIHLVMRDAGSVMHMTASMTMTD